LDAPLAFLLPLSLVAYGVAIEPALSQAKLAGLFLQIALFYTLVNGLRNSSDFWRFARFLLLATTAIAILGLLSTDWQAVRLIELPQIYSSIPELGQIMPGIPIDPDPTAFSPRRIGAALALLLPLATTILFFGRRRSDRILALIAALIGGAVLLLSQAIMGVVGFACALLLVASWKHRQLRWITLLGLLALAIMVLIVQPLPPSLFDQDNPIGIAAILRLDMWRQALHMIHDTPFTGVGLDNFQVAQTHFYIGHLLGPETHAHNLLLQTMTDLGVIGLFILLWLMGAFFYAIIYVLRVEPSNEDNLLLIAAAAGVVAYLVGGLLDGLALGDRPALILSALLGLGMAIAVRVKEERDIPGQLWDKMKGLWAFVIPACLIVLGVLLSPSARQRNLAAVTAHQLIYNVRQTGEPAGVKLAAATGLIQKAIQNDPDNPFLRGDLASLLAWQSQYDASISALRQRVALDGQNPLGLYAPFTLWQRQLAGQSSQDAWLDTLLIYRHWRNRYPDRAETYVLTALVWAERIGEADQAIATLQQGMDRGAAPIGLLDYAMGQIAISNSDNHG
jgi:O-antigen ligase